jgi:large subunit ribosomal protein L21
VLTHGRDDKVIVFKKKRRVDYHKKLGHRQRFTTVRIDSIEG